MNDLKKHLTAFDDIEPFSGDVAKGFYPDWTGALTDARFRAYQGLDPDGVGGGHLQTRRPTIEDGEGWFEAISQVAAAREARDRYVMITLGACYGAQAVNAYLVLKAINPLPCTLVAVEPEPENLQWVAKHFRDNGIDPDDHWLIGHVISDTTEPALFPVGAPGSGAQNAVSTNSTSSRQIYASVLTKSGKRAKRALRELLLHNALGLKRNLLSGAESDRHADFGGGLLLLARRLKHKIGRLVRGEVTQAETMAASDYFDSEIKLLSAVTMKDLLAPFERVDYLEVDIQQSEIVVLPPFMDLLKKKVRRIHIGTHGKDVHNELAQLFRRNGWDIVFDFEPNQTCHTDCGSFDLNDGILTVLNPGLDRTNTRSQS